MFSKNFIPSAKIIHKIGLDGNIFGKTWLNKGGAP
jgi:hypothetical protein